MKIFAIALAIAAGLMFLLPLGFYLFCETTYDFTEYATFVGGTAGPLAALAGFLFIYLTFQHQQEQLKNHEEQFELQSFENTFFNLLNYYRDLAMNLSLIYKGKRHSMDEFKDHVKDKIGFVSRFSRLLHGNLALNSAPFSIQDTRESFKWNFYAQEKQLQQLIKPLLSIVQHIVQSKSRSDEQYFSILISQIPEAHLYVYFYYYITYCKSSFSLVERVCMYELLSRVSAGVLVHESHKNWIEEPPYHPKKH